MTLLALAAATGTALLLAAIFGFHAFGHAWTNLHAGWLALVVGTGALAIAAYVPAYRGVSKVGDGPELPLPLAARIVLAGFGPFTVAGGFMLDKRALTRVVKDERAVSVRVAGLGALEWALLAPPAWLAAVVLLAEGDSTVKASLLWPWAIAVPLGFAGAFALASEERAERLAASDRALRRHFGLLLCGVVVLKDLIRSVSSCWSAMAAMALYWSFEIASLYSALRFIGARVGLAPTILGLATGYALTRRSMPLAGAAVTEAMMTFSLHWVGVGLASALAAVIVFRGSGFTLLALPALAMRATIRHLVEPRAPRARVQTDSDGRRRPAALPARGAEGRSA
jgi:uncharacterized membrane protein YbhN (UPF0104 family)